MKLKDKIKKMNLINMDISAVALVDKGANNKRFFLHKKHEETMELDKERAIKLYKMADSDELKQEILDMAKEADREEIKKSVAGETDMAEVVKMFADNVKALQETLKGDNDNRGIPKEEMKPDDGSEPEKTEEKPAETPEEKPAEEPPAEDKPAEETTEEKTEDVKDEEVPPEVAEQIEKSLADPNYNIPMKYLSAVSEIMEKANKLNKGKK